jgi:hypothetical protein
MSTSGASSSSATLTGTPSSSTFITDTVTRTVVNLFCMINKKTHVLLTLELHRPNFIHWSTFFKAMLGKFGLLPFLDCTVPAHPDDPVWVKTDEGLALHLGR